MRCWSSLDRLFELWVDLARGGDPVHRHEARQVMKIKKLEERSVSSIATKGHSETGGDEIASRAQVEDIQGWTSAQVSD